MHDIHCHILPGVDDGAQDITESVQMIRAAMRIGIKTITCTPHCRDPWFDYDAMQKAFCNLKQAVESIPQVPKLLMGFEVNYKKLMHLGLNWIDRLASETGIFLLELPTRELPIDWERLVFEIQGKGYLVVIAHPERYKEVQEDIEMAYRFVKAGCKIQISSDFYFKNKRSIVYKTAKKLFEAELVHFMASDAHTPSDYKTFYEAKKDFMAMGAHARLF